MVYAHFGIHLTEHKKSLIVNRLFKYVSACGFISYSGFIDHVEADSSGRALNNLADLISTKHTYFFREETHFSYLKNEVLPELTLHLQRQGSRDLRIWCAAASTGEEAYTLMMIFHEYFGPDYAKWDAGLLATDISREALKQAMSGIYTEKQVQDIPSAMRNKYLKKLNNGTFKIVLSLRSEVLFRKFNLMTKVFPFKNPFHVIFCRNVMIYFDSETRQNLIGKLYDFTAPGGYLFIGLSETLHPKDMPYQYIRPAVYRKPRR